MIIPFGEWKPDQADLRTGISDVNNAVPALEGYRSMDGLSVYSTAIDARCQGAFSLQDDTGNAFTFAGNATKLYRLVSTTPTDYSIAGGYSTGSDERWAFAKYGERVIATNWNDYPQSYVLNDGYQFSNLTTEFKARVVANVGEFVFFGNTWDSTNGSRPNYVRWSALGDPTNYTSSRATQSGAQEFPDGGWVQAIIGGEYATIFQEHAITRGTPVGGSLKYSFDKLEDRGTPAAGSVIKVGGIIYYLGHDGFYAFDGNSSTPIGAEKVDKYFLADVDKSYFNRITSCVDPETRVVMWGYPDTDDSGVPSKVIMYHWPTGKWSKADLAHQVLFNYLTAGYTLEELDAFGNIDTITPTLDSKFWMGGEKAIGAFDSSNQLNTFTGTALSATFDTNEIQMTPQRKTMARELRPLIDGGTTTLTVGTRNNQADSVSYGSALIAAPSGRYATRSTARYHRFKQVTTGAFTHATGIEVNGHPRGSR